MFKNTILLEVLLILSVCLGQPFAGWYGDSNLVPISNFCNAEEAPKEPPKPFGSDYTQPNIQNLSEQFVTNILGSHINLTAYVYQGGFSFFGTEMPLYGNESDLEVIARIINERNVNYVSSSYYIHTVSDAIISTIYNAASLVYRQPRPNNPMAAINFSFFVTIILVLFIYFTKMFQFGLAAFTVTILVAAWRFSTASISADIAASGFLSMVATSIAVMHYCYGQTQRKGLNPIILLVAQFLHAVSFDCLFLCDTIYYRDNTLWILHVITAFIVLVILITSTDVDSTRGAAMFFLISIVSQSYYFFAVLVRSKVFGPPTLVKYYHLAGDIINSRGSIIIKIRDFQYLISSGLQNAYYYYYGEIDPDFDVAGTTLMISLVLLATTIYFSHNIVISYLLYSLRISKTEADRNLSIPVQYVMGICRFIMDVTTNILGLTGNSIWVELQRFNSHASSMSGAVYLVTSIVFDSFLAFSPRFLLPWAIVSAICAYVLLILLSSEQFNDLLKQREAEQPNLSFQQKMALLATGRQFIPHAYSPYVGLNVTNLGMSAARTLPFENDSGNKSNVVPIADNKFLICLHQLFSNVTESNIASYNVKDIIGKIVSIGTVGKYKITEVFVPFQKANLPDRVICCQVDKPFASAWLKPENIQSFISGLDCVVYSKNRVDPREGRVLSCSSKDVFMHTVPTEPGDSGGLITALNGRSIGLHAGSQDQQKVSFAFRLDTILPQVLDNSRRVDPKTQSSILSLSEERELKH